MRLLVSVRSAAEAREAVLGGADIVDAKEPARGPLGAVDLSVLGEVVAAMPRAIPISAALGDLHSPAAAAEAVAAAGDVVRAHPASSYLKLGFHGVSSRAEVDRVLAAAAAAARKAGVGLVAVAYADHRAAGTPDIQAIADLAAVTGIAGVLVDTWAKDGADLLGSIPLAQLGSWIQRCRHSGLVTAVAGRLDRASLQRVRGLGADIGGVRGAACEAGRLGSVSARLVSSLKEVVKDTGGEATSIQATTALAVRSSR